MSRTLITITCPNCGSDDVACDASVRWDVRKQEWTISAIYDDKQCDACSYSGSTFNETPCLLVTATGECFHLSTAIANAGDVSDAVSMINQGTIREGVEEREYTPEQMAGQYAWASAGDQVDTISIDGGLLYLNIHGAKFKHLPALEHALRLAHADCSIEGKSS